MSIKCEILDAKCYQYALEHSVKEPAVLAALRAATLKLPEANMMSSPEQGNLIAMLMRLINAKRVIELGTFTGYTSLWMALALHEDGELITCDIHNEAQAIGQQYWRKAGVDSRIDFRQQTGLSLLDELTVQGHQNQFDLAYIDADKGNYSNYFEKLLPLIRSNGLIIVDNVLWGGKVVNAAKEDERTQLIAEFNDALYSDHRVDVSMLLIGDGLSLIHKKDAPLSALES